jgi:uncharacterized membrane protein YozB (DUF420 family)
MTVGDLPTLNAFLNLVSAVLLTVGRYEIKHFRQDLHRKIMIAAVVSSAFFLTSYLIYHSIVGSVPYAKYNWTRPLYFAVLIPHVFFAGLIVPFILLALYYAFRKKFDKHKKVVRIVWPVWMFVSVSGIVVYLMLYRF